MPEAISSSLQREYSSFREDPTFFYGTANLPVTTQDVVLKKEGAGKGLAIYRDLERDPKVFAVLQKRVYMTLTAPLRVSVGRRKGMAATRDDRKMRDMVEYQLQQMGYQFNQGEDATFARVEFDTGIDGLMAGLLDALLMGYSVAEIMWEADGREVYVSEARVRDQTRFQADSDHNWRLKTRTDLLTGQRLPAKKFLFFTWGSKWDPYGRGLGHQLFWPVFFKRHDISYWLRFLDKYGGPTAVVRHMPGILQEDKDKLARAAAGVHNDSVVLIPDTASLELLESIKTAAQSGYDMLMKALDDQIAQAVLGVTLTTDAGNSGSRAATQSQRLDQGHVGRADAITLLKFLNRNLIKWIAGFNSDRAVPPILEKVFPDYEAMQAQATIDNTLYQQGWQRTLDSVNETYGQGGEVYQKASPVRPVQADSPDTQQEQQVQDESKEDGSLTGDEKNK